MAKATKTTKKKSILTAASLDFLKNYHNTHSPVGLETSGQKVWREYIKTYIGTRFTDS